MASKATSAEAAYWAQGTRGNRKPTTIDLAKDCAKSVSLYAALNLVLFYWQQKGLLATQAATSAMWVCALLAGYQLGKCVARGLRDA